jgi:hypothetical protein
MQNQNQSRNEHVLSLIAAAQAMQAVLTGDCEHPHNSILTQSPRSAPSKQECLVCRQVRTQKWRGGPWGAWRTK